MKKRLAEIEKRHADEKRKEMEDAIKNLKLRVYRLENPPKFTVGETVMFNPGPYHIIDGGLIVGVKETIICGKINVVEYSGCDARPMYKIFCPEKEDTYYVHEAYVSKNEPKKK